MPIERVQPRIREGEQQQRPACALLEPGGYGAGSVLRRGHGASEGPWYDARI